ncbi:dUTPase-like protein [Daldinia decipiens]|uniref:dUTPase-like protein n=1 Tax=Daldinia decipiens TaxID=326647 RepID=UPI0020C40C5B|nr:dUTPase-like protein [Daldinia decipiens]KAI1660176.1 dUTPase-like protein [Daldinia decipiens]
MTATTSVTSPPTSPPAKRVKTTPTPTPTATTTATTTTNNNTTTATTATTATETMSPSSSTTTTNPPVPNLDQSPPLLIKKLSPAAKLPTRGSPFSAGYDLYAAHPTTIPSRGKALVDTDIAIAVPAGTYGRIAPRSGLAAKHFIDTGAGVIDADYRGQVKVLLFNHSDADFAVAEGDRVAQLVVERIYTPEVLEVQELEESVRGAGGFGSTGTN